MQNEQIYTTKKAIPTTKRVENDKKISPTVANEAKITTRKGFKFLEI